MKYLITTIAAVVLVGYGESQQSAPTLESKPEPPKAKAPDISIHNAASGGDIEAVKQHLTAGTDANVKGGLLNFSTPLTIATMNGHTEIAKLLIAKGVDINAPDKGGWTPLHFAAWDDNKEITELLIAKGANVNAKNNDEETVLHVVGKGNKEIVKLLIAEGADVNTMDNLGRTPLTIAIASRDNSAKQVIQEIIDLLRKHGAKTGEELLAEKSILGASKTGNIKLVEKHLSDGSDVNTKDGGERTALHWAALKGHKEVAELLIAKGSDVNARDIFYKTPLDKAINPFLNDPQP